MSIEELKDIWNYAVAGPQLLFALRMASLLPLGMYALARWYSVFFPAEAGEGDSRLPRALTRAGMALGTSILSIYLLLSGTLEFDRAFTPVRLVVANVGQMLLFWSLLMLWIINRRDYWANTAHAERRDRRATDKKVRGGRCVKE